MVWLKIMWQNPKHVKINILSKISTAMIQYKKLIYWNIVHNEKFKWIKCHDFYFQVFILKPISESELGD